jgi:4-amino-4-deoxy-L-arabinose transferase-like glycosyltransferase
LRKILLLTLLCGLFFFLGNNIIALTNPDEVFYVGTAKEMAQHGTWTVPYLFGQPQFEKPILTYWLLRAGLIIFGDTPFGARFFPALFALFGVLATYWLASLGFGNRRKGFFSAVILMSSFLYVGLARTVFTDMIFSVLITLSLAAFFWAYQRPRWKSLGLILFYFLSALAVLAKGPLGVVIPFVAVLIFLVMRRESRFLFCWPTVVGITLFLLVSLPWYVLMLQHYGQGFIQEFYYNDHLRRIVEAEHGSNDTWYFYPATMLFGLFPWTIFLGAALVSLVRNFLEKRKTLVIHHFLFIWVIVVFAIFQAAHSKLVSYVFPFFPALAILAGDYLEDRLRRSGGKLVPLFYVTAAFFFVLPLTLLVGIRAYPVYLPPIKVVLLFVFATLALVIGLIFLIKQRKLLWTFYALAAQGLVVLGMIFFANSYFTDYVTSANSVTYLRSHYQVEGRVLASKMLMRGTRYYSGWDMAYLNTKKAKLFSPHPVPDLDSDSKVLAFLKAQPVTYGIIDKKSWKVLERVSTANGMETELLKVLGDQFIVRVKAGTWPGR